MPTGACGIDCDACRLSLLGVCSSCGGGRSPEAARKKAAQERLLGGACPILACAMLNQLDYCPRDCLAFPCENFSRTPYPYSRGFLNMQQRRRSDPGSAATGSGQSLRVPAEHWDDLARRDLVELCRRSLAEAAPQGGLCLAFLNRELHVDLANKSLRVRGQDGWKPSPDPLLELIVLVYLLNAKDLPLAQHMVSAHELREGHFFQGPHALETRGLLARYGRDAAGFSTAAQSLGGTSLDLADAAFRLQALPRVPLYYLLWQSDEEFGARLSILFDLTIQEHLSADAIWGLVKLVSQAILRGPEQPTRTAFQ